MSSGAGVLSMHNWAPTGLSSELWAGLTPALALSAPLTPHPLPKLLFLVKHSEKQSLSSLRGASAVTQWVKLPSAMPVFVS